ncbi:MAG: transcriptional repressor LexA [Elusimicrobiota bacterium]
MAKDLTGRQRSILDFIAKSVREAGVTPTLREIARHFSVTAGGVQKQIRALEAKGVLRRTPGAARGLRVAARRETDMPPRLPVLGFVPAGVPAEAIENVEGYLSLDSAVAKNADYLLRIKGDSMADEFLPGDLVFVRQTATADNGDAVIARVEGDEATVKRLRRSGRESWLEPANPRYPPLRDKPFAIIGKVVGLVRSYGRRKGR